VYEAIGSGADTIATRASPASTRSRAPTGANGKHALEELAVSNNRPRVRPRSGWRQDDLSNGFPIAVLVSGSGTNLQAIIDQVHGRDGIEVVAVASSKPACEALERAEQGGHRRPAVFEAADHTDRAARDRAMAPSG
jgi:hypothetical protein